MGRARWTSALILCVALSVVGSAAQAQGKGKGKGYGGDNKPQQAQRKNDDKQAKPAKASGRSEARAIDKPRGNAEKPAVARGRDEKPTGLENARGRANVTSAVGGTVTHSSEKSLAHARFVRPVVLTEVRPSVKRFAISNRAPERIAGAVVTLANLRGLPENAFVITSVDQRVLIKNRKGVALVSLDDDRARNIGSWTLVPVDSRVVEGAPSFCRSGAGHPVWGRQWCIDKGFGLGNDTAVRWGQKKNPDDIVFRALTPGQLSTDALRNLLGDVVFDRLALHAITLGLADPLTGTWLGEPTGPRVLLLTSSGTPVAEIVDANRDNRAETLIVALRPW